VAINKYVLQRI